MTDDGRVKRFLALSTGDRQVFAQAWILLLKHSIALRLCSRERVGRVVADAMKSHASGDSGDLEQARHWLKIANRAARHHVVRTNCLVRSLAGREMLARRRVDATLRIGVSHDTDGGLQAHAWLESAGEVINDASDVTHRFVPFDDPRGVPQASWRWT